MVHFLETRYKGVLVTAPSLKRIEEGRYKLSVKSSKLLGDGGVTRGQMILRKTKKVNKKWIAEAVNLTSSKDIILELEEDQLPTTIQGRLVMQKLITL